MPGIVSLEYGCLLSCDEGTFDCDSGCMCDSEDN